MKSLKYLFIIALVAMNAISCRKGLDPIDPVTAGQDVSKPTVLITYPIEGKPFVSQDSVGTITIKLEATDDIELKSVVFQMDGAEIGSITSFKDYRRAVVNYPYTPVLDGNHTLVVTVNDLTGKSVSQTVNFKKVTAPGYTPMDGEVLYFPLDNSYLDLIAFGEATVAGNPGFAAGKVNDCYAGATDAYMKYPSSVVTTGSEFSVAFWYKLNPVPTRGGIISISAPGEERKTGFRMFREDSGTKQNLGINFGIGTDEVWMNPFLAQEPGPDWMHIAVSIGGSNAVIYVNGAVALEKVDVAGALSWTGCSSISIASGAPNFIYWEHFSDLSMYDEMHFFTRAITAEEVLQLYTVKKK